MSCAQRTASAGRFLLFVLASLLSALPALAQQSGDDQQPIPEFSEDVTVTAPRVEIPKKDVAGAVTVINADVLESMPRTIAPDEALGLVPGVLVDNQANGTRVHMSIRGIGILTERGIRGIQVLLDGIPLNDPSGFAPDLFDVDWSTVDRIEVLRGPMAMLYGGGSSGGVVNILTRDGGAVPAEGGASAWAGSNGFWKAGAEVGGTSGELNYHVSLARHMGDGWRVHTKFYGDNVYGKLHWTPSRDFRLTWVASYTGSFSENPEGLNLEQLRQDPTQPNPDAVRFDEYQNTVRVTNGLTGAWKIAAGNTLNFTLLMRHWSWRESVPSSVQHRIYDQPAGNLRYDFDAGGGTLKNHLSLGVDLNHQDITHWAHPNLGAAQEGPQRVADDRIHQRGTGLFAMDRLELDPEWGLFAGSRWDKITNELTDHLVANGIDLSGAADFQRTTHRVGVTFNPAPELGLYADWAQGFLPPATEELYANPDAIGGFNTHLVPATSRGEEAGVRGLVGGVFSYDVALFHLLTDNDFERYRVAGRPLETFYGNAGHSRRNGAEVFLTWVPVRPLTLRLAYTYSDFVYTSYVSNVFTNPDGSHDMKGHVVPNVPRHAGSLDAEVAPVERLRLGASVEHRSRWYVDPTNVPFCDGYTLVDARAAYRIAGRGNRSVEVVVYGKNLTDQQYVGFSEPDPDGNSYQPAPGRQWFAGLHLWL
jgi:iron complex outermembrane receptor protein